MKPNKKLSAAITAGALLFTLASCSDDSNSNGPQARQTAANGDVYNDADVDFATAMIPHHAQALAMVDLTRGRELSPDLKLLTETIQAAQGLEIETMVDWLTAWGEPIPETMRDHVNAEDPDMSGDDMGVADVPGMMTDADLAELDATQGEEFETMWLELMIRHHEGAIEMARAEREDGTFGPALKLASSIASSQKAEIDNMEKLLAP